MSYVGEASTWLHNANLYNQLGDRNPIKDQDQLNHAIFNIDEKYSKMNKDFVSPLKILDTLEPELWEKMNTKNLLY